MIENPYKRNAPVPKKASKVSLFPRMFSLRTIIVGVLLLLAILTWYLHVRGDYTAGDANGIPAGKLRGKGKSVSVENSKRNGMLKQEDSEEETAESIEPIINKWRESAKLTQSSKPSASPTAAKELSGKNEKKPQSSNAEIATAELDEISKKRNAALKHATLREEHVVATVTATTQPPIQVQRTLPHEEQAPDKQHDDDDVKEEEGEPQQPVKLITGKAKKPSSAADKVVNNIDLRTPPVARVTPRVIMSTGLGSTTVDSEKGEVEQRPVTLVLSPPDRSKKSRAQLEQNDLQKEEQKVEHSEGQKDGQREKEEEEQAQAQTQGDKVRGQAQVPQPDADAEEKELHDTLQAEITSQEEEARRVVIRPKVLSSSEDRQQQQQQQEEAVQIPTTEQKEQEEIRQRRDSALKHAMLRDEQKVTVTNSAPDPLTDTTTTTTSDSSSSSKNIKVPTPPVSGSKNGAKKTVATVKVSNSKVGNKVKSVTSKYQKPKQPLVPPKMKKFSDQPDTPESRKLAAANAAAAAAGAFDLLDIEHLTPVEVADGGNHEKDTATAVVGGEGQRGGEGAGVVGPMDCSGSSDPFVNVPIETYEPPAKADLMSKMEWGDAVRDMIARITHMKIGGDTLRAAIRDEIRTMQVLRVKLFCEAAAAVQKEAMEKQQMKEKQTE